MRGRPPHEAPGAFGIDVNWVSPMKQEEVQGSPWGSPWCSMDRVQSQIESKDRNRPRFGPRDAQGFYLIDNDLYCRYIDIYIYIQPLDTR